MPRTAQGTLLTFTGFHDPYSDGPVEGSRQPGPILSLLGERSFRRVILFSTPSTVEVTEKTREAIAEEEPDVQVAVRHLELPDPTDYSSILQELRRSLRDLAAWKLGDVFIATASGTPQMHACWILLVTSGELPGRLLHVRPPRFVSRDAPMVTEVDLSEPEFSPLVLRESSHFRDVGADELDMEEPFMSALALPSAPSIERSRVDRVIEATSRPEPDLAAICEQEGIVGDDPGMIDAVRRAVTVAPYDEPVLIFGENGTGKELIARLIHRTSHRSGGPLVSVNCSAIPEDLAESILFGHKKGSFTGAIQDEQGKFRLANGGTLFLDEVGELSFAIQAKLLKAVEYQVIEPVGEGRESTVDIRIVTATNRNLWDMVGSGSFRKDLYYRLVGALVEVPPLRSRRSDISKLAIHFLEAFSRRYRTRRQFTTAALRRLQHHDWPGNVRELGHVVRAAAMLAHSGKIEADDIELLARKPDHDLPEPHDGFSVERYLAEVRRKLFERALEISQGNQAAAARLLGVSGAAVSKFVNKERPA